ncbi:MAG TPA: hypothetical protein VEX38_02520 [Fimbriimonadaceae bacterium]|nr:hypothetical protein [Fimbriimonadaceae bacterium]
MNRVFACFTSQENADRAAGALIDHGVRAENISLIRKGEDGKNQRTPHAVDDAMARDTTYGNVTPPSQDAHPNIEGSVADMPSSNYMGSGMSGVVASEGAAFGFTGDGPEGAPADERGTSDQYAGRNDRDFIYQDQPSEAELNDVHYRAANKISESDYTEERVEMERQRADDSQQESMNAKSGITTTTAADAGAGALKGAGVGLGVGAVAALASLFVPGFGLVVGGGALATALAAAAASAGAGAAAGAVTGYLKDQGMEVEMAEHYEEQLQTGHTMLEINYDGEEVDAEKIDAVLSKYGATDVADGTGARRGYMA